MKKILVVLKRAKLFKIFLKIIQDRLSRVIAKTFKIKMLDY